MQPNSVVITGATGFIGAAVHRELLRRNMQPLTLLRPGADSRRLTALNTAATFQFSRFDEAPLAANLARYNPIALIHCAWRGVGGAERNDPFQLRENIPLTLATVRLAAQIGCRHWIGLGSQAEYGNPNTILDELAPTRPTTTYGHAKLAAGQEAMALSTELKMIGSWLRVFSTYGPGDHPHWFIPQVISEFLHNRAPKVTLCEQRWDYLFVEDAARAIVQVTEKKTGGIFNLGSGQAPPLRDTLELIRKECGTKAVPSYGAVPYRDDQVFHLQADIRKLSAATGWYPRVSLAEGLRATIAYERQIIRDSQDCLSILRS